MPAIFETSPFLASKSLMWYIGLGVLAIGVTQTIVNISNVMRKLGCSEFFGTGIQGLYPIIQWVMCVTQLFANTEWAWRHPALATVLLSPSFCLINSKMIVNNVTDMETELEFYSFFMWYMLIPVNK